MEKDYIGDGVYVELVDNGFDSMLKLTTERSNGEHVIYLDQSVYEALLRYVKRLKERGTKETNSNESV